MVLKKSAVPCHYRKALIDLYRQDETLLERRGISAPGREAVKLSNE
jgi:hypothetical protein